MKSQKKTAAGHKGGTAGKSYPVRLVGNDVHFQGKEGRGLYRRMERAARARGVTPERMFNIIIDAALSGTAKRSAFSYVATLSPKMSREWDDIAAWMGGVDVGWLIHTALETEIRCLNEDKTFRGDLRENYMIDKTNGVKVPLRLEREGAR